MELKDAIGMIEKKFNGKAEEMVQAAETVKKHMDDEVKKFSNQVETLNIELTKKQATIEEISGEVKELKAAKGRIKAQEEKRKSLKSVIAEKIEEHKEAIAGTIHSGLIKPIELKAVGNISSSSLTGDSYVSYLDWRPGMEPMGQLHFRDLVRTIQSETDTVQFPRANTPIGEGSFARVAEGATKPQVDRDYTMVTVNLSPIAGYAIVSRQSLRNIVFLQSWLPQSMTEQLLDTEDTDFANKLVAAATGSPTTTGATVAIERLIFMIKNLMTAKHKPNGIAVDPAVWAQILVYRPGTDNGYGYPAVVSVGPDGTVRVLGIPIYPVNWLTGNRVIVGDWSKAAIVQSEGLIMRQSDSHASIFTSNEIAFLLERTENLAIFRTEAFITAVLS